MWADAPAGEIRERAHEILQRSEFGRHASKVTVYEAFDRRNSLCLLSNLNRLAAESQINGGMIQSIGMALYEGRIMDSTLGVMVNPAFNDYKLAGVMEMPLAISGLSATSKATAGRVVTKSSVVDAISGGWGVSVVDL